MGRVMGVIDYFKGAELPKDVEERLLQFSFYKDAADNSNDELNGSWRFTDESHPLAHGPEDDPMWQAEHERILDAIAEALSWPRNQHLDTKAIAAALPKARGGIGVSERYARKMLHQSPEALSSEQVEALCGLFGCTTSFLRQTVRYAEQRPTHGTPEELAEIYRILPEFDKEILWRVAFGILSLHRELFLDSLSWLDS